MAQPADNPLEGTRTARLSFRLRASLDQRVLAIDVVCALIGHVEAADRQFENEMITAFGEAFNNIAIHGYRDRTDGMLEVEAELGPDRMTLRLIDSGAKVDFRRVAPPDLSNMPESGMGVFMMHALVDEVAYRSGSPNVLSLTKRATKAVVTDGGLDAR